MISQEELPSFIEKSIPELSGVIKKNKCKNAYDVVRQMLTYTTSQVVKHNLDAAKKCLLLAAQLYKKGNAHVKNAIENVYVYSFSHAFFHDEEKRKQMMEIIPLPLYELYKKQVINSHL
jgi:hypothetical protein